MKFVALRICLMSLALAGSALAQDEEDYYDEPAPAPAAQPEQPRARRAPPPGYGYAPRDEFVPLASLPATRPYRSNRGAPEGYVLSDEPRRGLIVAGVSVVGAAYFTGLLVAGVADDFPNQSGYLVIPVLGPWITLAARDNRYCGDSLCPDDAVKRALTIDGIFQAIGTGLVVTGLVWTRPVWLREDLAKHLNLVPGVNVATLPGMPQPQGVSVVGRF